MFPFVRYKILLSFSIILYFVSLFLLLLLLFFSEKKGGGGGRVSETGERIEIETDKGKIKERKQERKKKKIAV